MLETGESFACSRGQGRARRIVGMLVKRGQDSARPVVYLWDNDLV